jgi:cytochrome P450
MAFFTADPTLAGSGSTRVTGWRACRAALTEPDVVSDPSLAGAGAGTLNNLLMMDGDLHHAIRRLLAPFFTRARV